MAVSCIIMSFIIFFPMFLALEAKAGDDDNTRMTTEENGVVIIIGVTVGILLVLIPLVVACVWFGTKKYDQLQEERVQRSVGRGGDQMQTAAEPREGSQRSNGSWIER